MEFNLNSGPYLLPILFLQFLSLTNRSSLEVVNERGRSIWTTYTWKNLGTYLGVVKCVDNKCGENRSGAQLEAVREMGTGKPNRN